MLLSIIAAHDKNRVIGHGGSLPWNIPADMRYFREVTRGKPIIMGRKTHESIGRALPGRLNIVVTRQGDYTPAQGCTVAPSLEEARTIVAGSLTKGNPVSEAMVIGGGELYKEALPVADKLYITEIEGSFPGDAFFPEMNMTDWELVSRATKHDADTGGYTVNFLVYTRKK